ncbi:MAG: nitroreductase family protein [Victivallales bacterium]|nr:nitroreductase family protein [Victivallales bacterium]
MEFNELLGKRRSVRRFKQVQVFDKDIRSMLEAARLAACASNIQTLRYIVIQDRKLVREVFENTAWAGLVSPKRNPEWEKNAPLTFIAVYAPRNSGAAVQANAGAAIQSMELAATDAGLGSCWLGAFKKPEVEKLLEIPAAEEVLYLLAVGYPDEEPVRDNIESGESMKYYLDGDDVLHVPKFTVDAITQWR